MTMKTELRDEILSKYADFLDLPWGLEISDGWLPLIDDLLGNFAGYLISHPISNFKIVQIKEKFGGLRVYVRHGNDHIFDLIDAAEKIAYETCELCGGKGEANTEQVAPRSL